MTRIRTAVAARRRDEGFTLVELLVAMALFAVIGAVFLTIVLGSNTSAQTSKTQHDVNEEARLAINRMARELRQAKTITAVLNPDGTTYSPAAITAVTFEADFDGDTCINGVAPPAPPTVTCIAASLNNPEVLTYCYDPGASRLVLISGVMPLGGTCTGGLPILAADVSAMKFEYRSNLYLYDTSGDGITTWRELDAAGSPVGNSNNTLNGIELRNVDSVAVNLTMLKDRHAQSYRTQVALRNNS